MRYLVIQTRDIGDVVLSTALCNALKAADPDAGVDMLTMDHCRGVVAGNPNIDEILVLEKSQRNSVRYMFGLLRDVRSRRYDVVLNVQGQIIGLLMCLFSGAKRRVGWSKLPWRVAHTDNVVFRAHLVDTGHGHMIDARFAFLEALGIHSDRRALRIWLEDAEVAAGRARLTEAGVDPERPLVALGVHAGDSYKRWPLAYFAHVAEWLIRRFDAQLFVFFAPSEEEYGKGLAALLPEELRPAVFDDIATRDIRELAGMFAHCGLYVGNDTGPRHAAQALDVPAFAVVSPASDKLHWIPSNHPRFRAVDCSDALGIPLEEWEAIKGRLTRGVDDGEWFEKLRPELVEEHLERMLEELGGICPPAHSCSSS